jgi:competence protein ComGC
MYLIDPVKEKLFEIESETGGTIQNYIVNKNGLYFYNEGKLNLYNQQLDSLVTMPLSTAKFSEVDRPLLKKINVSNWKTYNPQTILLVTALLVLCLLSIVLFVKNKNLVKFQQNVSGNGFHKKSIEVNKQVEFSDNLTETEKSVLDILYEYSKQGEPTSIDQINRALGVKNKEVTIQNKLRSDTLQMINKKFMVFASTSDTLVEREKTALDKRVYQYKLNERYLNKIK